MATITGTNGDDVLDDTAGSDLISGLDGDDIVNIQGGNDTVYGGAGVDTLVVNYAGDAHNFTMTNGVDASGGISGAVTDGLSTEAIFNNFEKFNITTGSGDDSINGTDGSDTISTGAGNDTVNSGKGADVIDFGTGINVWNADKSDVASNISVDFTTSTYSGPGSTAGSFSYTNSFTTGSGNDTIISSTGPHDETFILGAGDDLLKVQGGNDTAYGGAQGEGLVVRPGRRDDGVISRAGSEAVGVAEASRR